MKSICNNLVSRKIDVQVIQLNGFYHVECDTDIKINKEFYNIGNRLLVLPDNKLILAQFDKNSLTEICEINREDVVLDEIAI